MKLLMCFVMMFSLGNPDIINQEASVIATTCYVYETASFDSPLVINDEYITLKHGDTVRVYGEEGEFSIVRFDYDNVNFQDKDYYIYSNYLTFNKVEQETYPVFNAKVANDNAVIYDLNTTVTDFTAHKGQGLFLYNGYSSKEEYTAVALVLDNGKVYYGFMKTEDIKPNGISAGLITGIVVLVTCLTIIFLLLFMRKKKRQ